MKKTKNAAAWIGFAGIVIAALIGGVVAICTAIIQAPPDNPNPAEIPAPVNQTRNQNVSDDNNTIIYNQTNIDQSIHYHYPSDTYTSGDVPEDQSVEEYNEAILPILDEENFKQIAEAAGDGVRVVTANPTIVAGVRVEGVSGNYENDITAKPGDVVDVEVIVRNTTGRDMNLGLIVNNPRLAEISGGAIKDGERYELNADGANDLGAFPIYNAQTGGGESVIKYKVRIPGASETTQRGSGVINIFNSVAGFDENGEKITDEVYQYIRVWVDFGEAKDNGVQPIQMGVGVYNGKEMFVGRVNANFGGEVPVQMSFKNMSGERMDNIAARIVLPEHLELVPGSTVLYNRTNPEGLGQDDGIALDFIGLGGYGPYDESEGRESGSVSFKVKVSDDRSLFVPGVNPLNIFAQVAGYQNGRLVTDTFIDYAAVDVTVGE